MVEDGGRWWEMGGDGIRYIPLDGQIVEDFRVIFVRFECFVIVG